MTIPHRSYTLLPPLLHLRINLIWTCFWDPDIVNWNMSLVVYLNRESASNRAVLLMKTEQSLAPKVFEKKKRALWLTICSADCIGMAFDAKNDWIFCCIIIIYFSLHYLLLGQHFFLGNAKCTLWNAWYLLFLGNISFIQGPTWRSFCLSWYWRDTWNSKRWHKSQLCYFNQLPGCHIGDCYEGTSADLLQIPLYFLRLLVMYFFALTLRLK